MVIGGGFSGSATAWTKIAGGFRQSSGDKLKLYLRRTGSMSILRYLIPFMDDQSGKYLLFTLCFSYILYADLVCGTSFESETSRYLKLVTKATHEDLRYIPGSNNTHTYDWWQRKCWGQLAYEFL